MTKRRLGELLQAEGLITEDQVRQGLEEQRKSNLFLGEALVKLGFVSEEAIAQTIVQQFSLPFMSAQQYNISVDVLNLFPERMYFEYQFIAVDKIGKVLVIIGAGLMNHDVLDELERLSGCKVCQFVSTWKDIKASLDAHAKDMRKEQTSLSSLGSMLLDVESAGPAGKPSPAPAPVAATPKPVMVPAAKSGVAPAIKPSAFPGTPSKTTMPAVAAAGQPQPPTSPRLSALAGVRPPVTQAPQQKAPTMTPNTAPADAKSNESGRNPAQPGKTGLLGLFKKQS